MFYTKYPCSRHTSPKLAILPDFSEGCIIRIKFTDKNRLWLINNLKIKQFLTYYQ